MAKPRSTETTITTTDNDQPQVMNRNPTRPKAPQQPMRRLLLLAALAGLACLLLAGLAPAATVTNDRPLLFSFDGSDTTAGAFTAPHNIDIDYSTGDVYVINGASVASGRVVSKFDANGIAQTFSATGTSSLDGSATPAGAFSFNTGLVFADVAVDNSAVNPGRIYVSQEFGPIDAFDPQGNYLWTLPRSAVRPCGIGVDSAGHLWVGDSENPRALEFDSTGSPPAQIGSVTFTHGTRQPCRLGFDQDGHDLYATMHFPASGVDKYIDGIYQSTLTTTTTRDVAVDQSQPAGHAFAIHDSSFQEFDSTDTELAGSPFGVDLIDTGRGVAYNPALDRVYVSDLASNTVKVFGPRVSGTVPDVSTQATDAITRSSATAHATINPLSLNNSYHFEWKRGTGASWGAAQSSPLPYPSIEPTDSADHSVSLPLTGLRANTTYQVRLVAANTDNHLNAYSAPDTFTTLAPPPPTVSDLSVSAITTSSAHVAATVDPQEDTTTWKLQTSTDPGCAAGFSDRITQTISNPGPGTVAVSANLSGLDPAQTYCLRLTAANANPIPASAEQVFQTLAIPPTDAQTAFAAPRTDSSARLNARVNPQGEAPLTYHFEWSADGSTWTPLPDRISTLEAREQIVVSDEFTGLQPDTTYHYRFFASNAAGPATPQGEARTFTTRTSAEATLPERGIELVNSPDKGNQHVTTIGTPGNVPNITPDGNKALWAVLAGAPEAPNASYNAFLATRSATRWSSRALAPPAAEQIGSGNVAYQALLAVPDLSRFVFGVGGSVVRLDDRQNQDLLTTDFSFVSGDLTDDGAHVVRINGITGQLEDIGTGTAELLSLMPDESESSCGLLRPGSFGGNSMSQRGYHWIATTDASRAYFQAPPNGACGAPLGLYLRNRDTEQTTLIAAGDPAGDLETRNVRFIRATPDGRSAYFLTLRALDPDDSNGHRDVYRWDEGAGASTCLTCVVADADPRGRVLVSDDFSHIYFESTRQLAPGQGVAGDVNLYLLSGGEIRFVADPNNSDGTLSQGNPELSADGNVLLFAATASPRLTTDPVASQCLTSGGQASPCQKLYRYDDRDQSLECVDCRRGQPSTRHISGSALSADGSTVAFTTLDALSPLDVNRDTDVYEWRNGSRRLLTDGLTDFAGAGGGAPTVWDLDASGANILFSVAAPGLTGFEADGLANLYDARIGGGFPRPNPPATCTEDACQGPLQPPPATDSPGSYTAFGPANPPAIFPRSCSRARRRVRVAKRRLRRATTPSAKRAARKRLRLAKRRLRRCRAGRR